MFSSAPVIASKPVANTMASSSYSASPARTPAAVISLDRRAAHIDQSDIRPIECRVVVGIDADPLGADRVVLRRQRSATAWSLTISRILSRTKSAAVSLASLIDDQVVERGHEVVPPAAQRSS